MAAKARAKAERAGRRAEFLAALCLQLRGYSILERRFKAAGGEVDLIARRGNLLVMAEVKARPDLDGAIMAVTARTRRRIEAAGRGYLSRHPRLAELSLRYDIIGVSGWRVERLKDAWREGE